MVSLAAKRQAAAFLEQTHEVSERRACRVLSVHRSTKRRQPGPEKQGALVARLHALSDRYPRYRYRKIYALRKGERWPVSRETVRRRRKREGLQVISGIGSGCGRPPRPRRRIQTMSGATMLSTTRRSTAGG